MKKSGWIVIAVICLGVIPELYAEQNGFKEHIELGHLKKIKAKEKYEFTIKVDEKAPGWGLMLDPFSFKQRKNLPEKLRQRWERSGTDTTVWLELTNTGKTIIDVAEPAVPFSSDSVKPGETITLKFKNFSHQMCLRKFRGTDPGQETISFKAVLWFEDDVGWLSGVHVGLTYVAVMHKHPEWFHESTRKRNWKKK